MSRTTVPMTAADHDFEEQFARLSPAAVPVIDILDLEPEFMVRFDEPRLAKIRAHEWTDVEGVVRSTGVDYSFFSNKKIAEVFASMVTYEWKPATVERF